MQISDLATDTIKFNLERQNAWKAHYEAKDPYGAQLKTVKTIITELSQALIARGVK